MVSTPGNLEANWSGGPSSIYSFSISHILKREFFCLGRFGSQGSKEKKWIWVRIVFKVAVLSFKA